MSNCDSLRYDDPFFPRKDGACLKLSKILNDVAFKKKINSLEVINHSVPSAYYKFVVLLIFFASWPETTEFIYL